MGDRTISSGATISIIVAVIALLGLAALVAFLVVRRRPDPQRDDRLARAVDDMRSRMDDLGRDLSDALERAERESKRNRFLSDLGNSIEFEELLDRVLDAALEVPGFDAAMVVLDEQGRSDFGALQAALGKKGRGTAPADRAVFYAFDLLFLDGHDLRGWKLENGAIRWRQSSTARARL